MIHHVFANRSNVGDWLSARGIQALLAPHPVVEHLCDDPFVPETIEALARAAPEDLIVIGGGGLFMDYFEPFWRAFGEIAGRVPFVLWGVGYCDLKRGRSRASAELLRDIVGRSRLCVVRDASTRRHLGAGVLPAPVPCPALLAVPPAPEPGFGLLHVDNYTTAGPDAYEAMEAAGRAFAQATGRPFRKTNNRIPPGSERALDETLRRYAASDLVLSSALHGCVLAAAMGRPVLAVSGDRKIEGFMEAAGLGDWVLAQDELHRLPERLARLVEQPSCEAFVRRARAANRAVAARLREILPAADVAAAANEPVAEG